MATDRKAIIIGGNHHNTLGVIRSLGRKGIRPYVVVTAGGPGSFVLKSNYIEKGWAVQGSEKAIDFLLSNFSDEQEKPVIFACHDVISSLLDLNHDVLSQRYILPGCGKQGYLTELMDKKRMGEMAKENQILIPQTFVINASNISLYEEIPFPCITKPVESRKGNKSEIHVCNTREELKNFLNNPQNKDFLVQRFVDKKIEFQLIGCSLSSGRDIIIPGVSVILRQPKTTNTGFLHYRELDESFEKAVNDTKNFLRSIGYSGLFSAEFLRDKKGNDFFMEINFRNDGNSIAVTNSGVNLPYIWYLAGVGKDYQSELNSIHEEYVMPEFDELELYASGTIDKRQWKEDMAKATSYMDYASDDPMPTNGWDNYRSAKRKIYIKRIIKGILRKL